ncbi:MAG: transglutaminase-like domain-containing protein [Desulfomonilaceae bacterium]|nr:transglutaminase-like domain-containing protein [Desulfomonilaceae bacterium]
MLPFRSGGKRRFNRLITIVIVGTWVVLMGALLRDEYMPAVAEMADAVQLSAVESDDWFLIRMGGAYAGFGRSRQIRKGSHWRLRDDLRISLNIQGQIKPVRIVSESDVDDDFRLISFRLKVSSGLIGFEHKGRMDGRTLITDLPGAKGSATKKIRLSEVPRISRSLGLPLPLTGLKVGDEIKIPIFDPMDSNKSDASIRVVERADLTIAGRKIDAWRVRASMRSVDLVMWIDDEGRLLKGRMPLGITVVRSDRREIANEMSGTRDLPELVSLTAVPVSGSIPDAEDLKLVRLQVQGTGDWGFPANDFRQKFENSELTVTREEIPKATYSLPNGEPQMEEYLKSSRFIRSDNPEIVKTAREIIGKETDPVKAARLINNWVFKNLKKVPTPAVPDAHTVLLSRQGDCNEHAVLAVSLARAVGLPAKIAVGLVYSGEGFYYHAWVAYWAGKTWFTGDPLMNQMPVGPTHVTLLYGDVDKHVNVISFLGRLKLKVLETGTERSG